jgi:3-oxoacyl-[acyl-carrier-protein] synthase-3
VAAASKLFASGVVAPDEIDFILLCTQSPDYILPTTACTLQSRLGIPTSSGALDFNLGCSGFIYGLGLAKGLIQSGQARSVLLITAETYSKFINPGDRSVRTLFGDGSAATLVRGTESDSDLIGPFIYGTDGTGAGNLIVPTGGARRPFEADAEEMHDESGNVRTSNNLYMNGAEIFNFTLQAVPQAINQTLAQSGKSMDDIRWFIFHQANKYMLDHLRRKMRIPEEKFVIALEHCGNTVSSSIPIALKDTLDHQGIAHGDVCMLVGFGVGYSWASTLLQWV